MMIGAGDQMERSIRQQPGDLLDRPAWANVALAVHKERRSVEMRELSEQRWPLDVRLPRAVDLGIDLQIGRVVERREDLKPLVAPLAVDPVPLAIVMHAPARDTDD